MQQIITFNPQTLLGYGPAQIAQLINTRSGNNINTAKSLEIKERILRTNEGLESLLNYISSLSINNV